MTDGTREAYNSYLFLTVSGTTAFRRKVRPDPRGKSSVGNPAYDGRVPRSSGTLPPTRLRPPPFAPRTAGEAT
ncbi:MAG: hypothetical protein MZV70_69655 [Desulfobacterales bacterium]|nr:hypothetical protein [Desulfobacterales bacterium]